MSPEKNARSWLIVSLSGRGLAKAAARAGRPTRGIDAYADRDTRGLSRDWARVPPTGDYSLESGALLNAAARLCPPDRCLGLVYGSGFESRPELLTQLAKDRRLVGNAPEVLAQTGDPARFFPLLRQLGIPHPEVSLTRPPRSFNWLSKQAGACGGGHILPASVSGTRPGRYFQRQVEGQAGSLLFLANGREIRPVGCNRALPAAPEAPSAWAYSGASRLAGESSACPGGLLDAALALTRALGLKGLNGIDFVVNGNDWWLLELNPRPTATVELWDVAPMPSLFRLHIQACRGRLPASLPKLRGGLTSAVVYSGETLRIPDGFFWPDWCSDLPEDGSVIAAGEPICTVLAAGENRFVSEHWAGELRQSVLRRLSRLQPCELPLRDGARAPSLPPLLPPLLPPPAGKPAWA